MRESLVVFELDRIRRRTPAPASILVGAVTLVVYGIEVLRSRSASPDVEQLLALGASERHAIWESHELWRLLCPAFLHGGLAHIAMNGYSFVQLAPFIERVWGWSRFLVVYVVSAIAGAALSSRASPAVSVGASGAIFGLIGFLIVAAYSGAHRHEVRTIVQKTWGQGLLISVGGVLAYGFTPGTHIDNMAHLGGLVAGALLGLILVETEEEDAAMRAMGAAAGLAIVAAWGANVLDLRRGSEFDAEWESARAAYARADYGAAAECCERALALRAHDARTPLIFHLEGLAYLRAGKLDEAAYTLERAWRNVPTPQVLALLVEVNVRRGDVKAARSWAKQLKEAAGPEGLGALLLDPETSRAIAAVDSG